MTVRRMAKVGMVVGLTACRDQAPQVVATRTVVGQFGGVNGSVEAALDGVAFQMPCDRLTFAATITPDADGQFVVQALGRSVNTVRPLPPSLLRGRLRGDTLAVSVLFLGPDTTLTAAYTLTRGRAPVYTVACAL